MLNKFLVAGRLTADPEIKTAGESRYCKFSIACERPKHKGEEKAEVDFFDCIAWNRNADVVVDGKFLQSVCKDFEAESQLRGEVCG